MTASDPQTPTQIDRLHANASAPQRQPFHVDPAELTLAHVNDSHRQYHMRIAADGSWFHEGEVIQRHALVKLFASVLRRGADGSFWLVTPAERGLIDVDDAPFVAVSLAAEDDPSQGPQAVKLHFTTNLDETVTAGPDHSIRVVHDADETPRPYIQIRPGLEALIGRAVFYELVERAEERSSPDGAVLGVWSENCFFELGKVEL
jgi:hypothetical protein